MNRPRLMVAAPACAILCVVVLIIPMSRRVNEDLGARAGVATRLDVSGFSAQPVDGPLDVLFIHHSVGGQLLAAHGEPIGSNSILESDPNGGGLRARLTENGYRVHEASYGSRIGEKTDLFDWLPKFRGQMEEILRTDVQDVAYADGRRNRIVMFKSCFPNSAFRSRGTPPGNPLGPELTVWNAKATYRALLDEFRTQPDVLFVSVTAPPLAPGRAAEPLWRQLARAAKRQIAGAPYDLAESGRLAREFNDWLADANGWRADYPLKNVVVFDYYDILTDHGQSNLSRYPTWDGEDSHPSREGNAKAAQAFVPFLNQAVRRLGLADEG